jgi:hypothetical protein
MASLETLVKNLIVILMYQMYKKQLSTAATKKLGIKGRRIRNTIEKYKDRKKRLPINSTTRISPRTKLDEAYIKYLIDC